MRASLFVIGLGAGLACSPGGGFLCEADDECLNGGVLGQCQADAHCSFPDAECESGQRYGEHAPVGLAKQCVRPSDDGDDGTTTTGPAVLDSGDSTEGGDGGTLALTSGMGSSSGAVDPPPTSEDGGSEGSTGAPVDQDLVLWLHFDDVEEPLADGSSYERVASCVPDLAACPPIDAGGAVGSAATFGGNEQTIAIAHDPALDDGDGLTVAVWVRNDALAELPIHTVIARPYGAATENAWELFFRDEDGDGDNDLVFEIADELGQVQLITPVTVGNGEWQHVVAVWTPDSVELWIDGELRTSAPAVGMLRDDHDIYVGGDLDTAVLTHFIVAGIDEVRIWRRALDDAEITAL